MARNNNYRPTYYTRSTEEKGGNKGAACPSRIGSPFHNPYTFIPFPDKVKRFDPVPLTIDEHPEELDRVSGILELDIKTLSPLMTCSPNPISDQEGHKTYKALTIGNDVIVPATGIRGALRTLMTIITGGTLGYLDEHLWLTQGRDAQLGPNTKMPNVPDNVFLAKIIRPGDANHPGTVELGETRLVQADQLKNTIHNLDRYRPTSAERPLTYEGWDVKLSDRPIRPKGKKEGLFKGTGEELELAEHFWEDYRGRHRHSKRPELKTGDLVWLEPQSLSCTHISKQDDIKSIQWARWGRHGEKLRDLLPKAILPDSMRDDGKVDLVTNLFGLIPHKDHSGAAGPLAARLRPGNLVFPDAGDRIERETLAPLAPPHPGCIAFYRDSDNLDMISKNSPLKGYKVYRNTQVRGDNSPWKYSVQGVYVERGDLKLPARQKVNRTADLLGEETTGKLRISFRGLDEVELSALLATLSVDWKLGGGKPLGLGHCRVVGCRMVDENGQESFPLGLPQDGDTLKLPADRLHILDDFFRGFSDITRRIALYKSSQKPVERLLYPRGVTVNNNKTSRAGLSWFARHASPKKTLKGLETIWTGGPFQSKVNGSQVRAQALPKLDYENQAADLLYGYDMVDSDFEISHRKQRIVKRLEPFDREKHTSPSEQPGPNTSQNRQTRQATRVQRTSAPTVAVTASALNKDTIGKTIAEEFEANKITPIRAREFLTEMEQLGITLEQSNKWKKRFKLLERIANT